MSIAEFILFRNPKNTRLDEPNDERRQKELNEVCMYAAEGDECRKWMLSNYACLNGDFPKEMFRCDGEHLCDNCRWKTKDHSASESTSGVECLTEHDVSYPVRKAIEGMIGIAQSHRYSVPEDDFRRNLKILLEKESEEATGDRNKAAVNEITKSSPSPLFYDLCRVLRIDFCTTRSATRIVVDQKKIAYTDWNSAEMLVNQLKQGDTKIILRNVRLPPDQAIKETCVERLEDTHARSKLGRRKGLRPKNRPGSDLTKALLNEAKSSDLPFLAHFELQRYDKICLPF
jgi:hypothetical protein